MKIRQVCDLETMPVSFRSACDISRACRPMWLSPISPSSSALGTRAATDRSRQRRLRRSGSGPRRFPEPARRSRAGRRTGCRHLRPAFGRTGIERVFGVDEGGRAPGLLGLGDDLERERGLAGRFRAEHFHDAATRKAANAEGGVKRNGARWRSLRSGRRFFRPKRMIEPLPNCFSICTPRDQSLFTFVCHDGSEKCWFYDRTRKGTPTGWRL